MSDRCCSTLVCAERDKVCFREDRLQDSKNRQAQSVDGDEIQGAVVMVAEEADNGNYDELTSLTGIPFIVCNGSRPGAFGDHLIVSDGKEWHYSEALHESNYPAIRVESGGVIRHSELDDAAQILESLRICAWPSSKHREISPKEAGNAKRS